MLSKLKSLFRRPSPIWTEPNQSFDISEPAFLPDDIFLQILQYVDFAQRACLRQVCQRWKFTIDNIKDIGVADLRFLDSRSHKAFNILKQYVKAGKIIRGLRLSGLLESERPKLDMLIAIILGGKHGNKFEYFEHVLRPPLSILTASHLKYLACRFCSFDDNAIDISALTALETLITSERVKNLKSDIKTVELRNIVYVRHAVTPVISELEFLKSCPPSLEVLGLYEHPDLTFRYGLEVETQLAFPNLRSLSMRVNGYQLPVHFDLTLSSHLESLNLNVEPLDHDYCNYTNKVERDRICGRDTLRIIDDFLACDFSNFYNLRSVQILVKRYYPHATSSNFLVDMVKNNHMEKLVIQVSLDPNVVSQILRELENTCDNLITLELWNFGFLDSAIGSENALRFLTSATNMVTMDLRDVIVDGEYFIPLVPELSHTLTSIRIGGVRMKKGHYHFCQKLLSHVSTIEMKPRTQLEIRCSCGGASFESFFRHLPSECVCCLKLVNFGLYTICYRYGI